MRGASDFVETAPTGWHRPQPVAPAPTAPAPAAAPGPRRCGAPPGGHRRLLCRRLAVRSSPPLPPCGPRHGVRGQPVRWRAGIAPGWAKACAAQRVQLVFRLAVLHPFRASRPGVGNQRRGKCSTGSTPGDQLRAAPEPACAPAELPGHWPCAFPPAAACQARMTGPPCGTSRKRCSWKRQRQIVRQRPRRRRRGR